VVVPALPRAMQGVARCWEEVAAVAEGGRLQPRPTMLVAQAAFGDTRALAGVALAALATRQASAVMALTLPPLAAAAAAAAQAAMVVATVVMAECLAAAVEVVVLG
jgi:hypothetical protein